MKIKLNAIISILILFLVGICPSIIIAQRNNKINENLDCFSIFDKLQENEFYIIHISSMGCFHSSEESFTIERKANEYYINSDGIEKQLTHKDIKLIKKFEKELKSIPEGGCTTSDKYFLIYKGKTCEKVDNTCNWNGASKLRNIFRKNK